MSDNSDSARIIDNLGHINLRGDPLNPVFVNNSQVALGQPLPIEANTSSAAKHRIYWLGPDEWLIVTAADDVAGVIATLNESLVDTHAAVNDLSGGQIIMQLTGSNACKILSKGCTLDFHPDVFRVGACAQSGLGKANVLIGLVDAVPTFDIVVRRSFSDYLARWLQRAATNSGFEFR